MHVSMKNGQGELIEIKIITDGAFSKQHILIIHDNLATGTQAPHLLDTETINWLIQQLTMLKIEEKK